MGENGNIPEISLNPDLLGGSALRWCVELAHNMLHYWQAKHGNSSRKGYHNTEYAEKSEEVGIKLLCKDGPEDKETGQVVTYTVSSNGLLMNEINYLEKTKNISSQLIFMFLEEKVKKPSAKQEKYTCPCNYGFMGKPGI